MWRESTRNWMNEWILDQSPVLSLYARSTNSFSLYVIWPKWLTFYMEALPSDLTCSSPVSSFERMPICNGGKDWYLGLQPYPLQGTWALHARLLAALEQTFLLWRAHYLCGLDTLTSLSSRIYILLSFFLRFFCVVRGAFLWVFCFQPFMISHHILGLGRLHLAFEEVQRLCHIFLWWSQTSAVNFCFCCYGVFTLTCKVCTRPSYGLEVGWTSLPSTDCTEL